MSRYGEGGIVSTADLFHRAVKCVTNKKNLKLPRHNNNCITT